MISIRAATAADTPLIYQFIQQKADFDRQIGAFQGRLRVTERKLHQTLFTPVPFAYVLLAEKAAQPVGFALYGFRYSSFAGQPSIWLDDLFVPSPWRSRGIGAALMAHLAHLANQHHCTHLAWTADDRNQRGLKFYERIGAQTMQRHGHRCWLEWLPDSLTASNVDNACWEDGTE